MDDKKTLKFVGSVDLSKSIEGGTSLDFSGDCLARLGANDQSEGWIIGYPYRAIDELKSQHCADDLRMLDGHFVYFLKQAPPNGGISLGANWMGMYPVFYHISKDKLLFASQPELIIEQLGGSPGVDFSALSDFFRFGYTLDGETLFSGIKRLKQNEVIEVKDQAVSIKKKSNAGKDTPLNLSLAGAAAKVAELFKKSLDDILKFTPVRYAHLSGGVDSRFILANMDLTDRQNMIFFSRLNPKFKRDEDRDVMVAIELAKKFGLNHIVQEDIETWDQYLDHQPPVTGPTLCGLHGGELLGGQAFNVAPAYIQDISFLLNGVEASSLPILKSIDETKFIYKNFLRAVHSTIYESVSGGWSSVYYFPFLSLSPFWDQRLVGVLENLPQEYLRNYKIYAEIFRLFHQDYCGVGLNSPIVDFSDIFMRVTVGVDPKDTQRHGWKVRDAAFDHLKLSCTLGFYDQAKLGHALSKYGSPLAQRLQSFENFFVSIFYYLRSIGFR